MISGISCKAQAKNMLAESERFQIGFPDEKTTGATPGSECCARLTSLQDARLEMIIGE